MRRYVLAAACTAAAQAATAADIVGLAYDPQYDTLVVEVAYRGTHAQHRFDVQWGPCARDGARAQTAGRLLDVHGRDTAREPFVVKERIDLAGLPCRPAEVTLRLGLRSHASVFVPARPSAQGDPDRAAAQGAGAPPGPAESRAR